ncbi:hypothetical protein BGW36DRAFT_390132 [Talaromyces proteolyticus]|uniref:Uncharacterized protein n=1 Tax=Talaromyces proteolyticus TaxID=1131652 RepID=A0AAD4PUF0_9EURO|nr:uncharacterized protein BGW36DRAFT_390132 [Talaromyces proteolyticus]KAH8690042.1 hypothetical protein BGW36DRAFT_390132 [Talaromyces proteolyticus]
MTINIFTPKCEVPFASHPTIGTASYPLGNASIFGIGSLEELVTKADHIHHQGSFLGSGSTPRPRVLGERHFGFAQ